MPTLPPAPTADHSQLPIAIVGGGVTGLAAAHRLVRSGRTVRLFELSDRLGGAVRSTRNDGWLIEAGPNSLQETPALAQLISELGLADTKLYAQPAARHRFIVRDGQPRAAPSSPPAFFKSKFFSWRAKFSLLSELATLPRRRRQDLSLAAFIRSHFGAELVAYGLDPFVSGIYAGDPALLSARHSFPALWEAERTHGSLIRAQITAARRKKAAGGPSGPPAILSFPEGLETLPRALAATLPAGAVELSARVHALTPANDGQPWRLTWSSGDQPSRTERFAQVILALPAAALADLLITPPGQRLLAPLAAITYAPVSSLFLGYRREQVAHALDGFGALCPSVERREVLGILFNSTLFTRRAPADHVALTVMTGGSRRPDLALCDDATLLPIVRRELAALLGIHGAPVFVRRTVWPQAIPQYTLGYERHLDLIARVEQAHPGLHVGGHVRDGIALTACLAAGERLAAQALGNRPAPEKN